MVSVGNSSRLGLGTAQFGSEYGISNSKGRVPEGDIVSILDFAKNSNIGLLDTASLYGDSEAILGKLLPADHSFRIVTKTPVAKDAIIDQAHCLDVERALYRSLDHLSQKSVYGLLVHDCNDLFKPGGDLLLTTLQEACRSGLVEKIGVSVYDGTQIDTVLEKFTPDIIQLPFSIADQRLVVSGHLKKLHAHGVEIHARSIFLQGALLMDPQLLPQHFDSVRSYFINFGLAAKKAGLSRLQACVQFVLAHQEIDIALVGVTAIAELAEIVAASSVAGGMAYDAPELALNDERYIVPMNWTAK